MADPKPETVNVGPSTPLKPSLSRWKLVSHEPMTPLRLSQFRAPGIDVGALVTAEANPLGMPERTRIALCHAMHQGLSITEARKAEGLSPVCEGCAKRECGACLDCRALWRTMAAVDALFLNQLERGNRDPASRWVQRSFRLRGSVVLGYLPSDTEDAPRVLHRQWRSEWKDPEQGWRSIPVPPLGDSKLPSGWTKPSLILEALRRRLNGPCKCGAAYNPCDCPRISSEDVT